MQRCGHCGAALTAADANCPACGRAAASTAGVSGGLDRGVEAALERVKIESLLARHDASDQLTLAMSEQKSQPLSLADIDQALERAEAQHVPSLGELEKFLASDLTANLSLEGMQLADLLEEGVDTRDLLRKGIIFLKNRRYGEALEWWSLHREQLNRPDSRVHMLLLVMEMLTCTLAGQVERAASVRQQILAHPQYHQLRRRQA